MQVCRVPRQMHDCRAHVRRRYLDAIEIMIRIIVWITNVLAAPL